MSDLDDLDIVVDDHIEEGPVPSSAEAYEVDGNSEESSGFNMKKLKDAAASNIVIVLLVASSIEFVASIVVGSATGFAGGDSADASLAGFEVWAFVGGLLSLLTCIAILLMEKFAASTAEKISSWISLFLAVLWLSVAIPCTFVHPFSALGNGWIGTWLAMIMAWWYMGTSFSKIRKVRSKLDEQTESHSGKYSFMLLISGIVVLIAVFVRGGDIGFDQGTVTYGILLSIVSIIGAIVVIVFANVAKEKAAAVNRIISIILSIWWCAGAFVLTFSGPMVSSSGSSGTVIESFNGYVGSWVSLFASVKLFQACALDMIKTKFSKQKSASDDEVESDA